MDKVAICHACGRTIDGAFFFCPWCGTAAQSSADSMPEISGRIDAVCEELSVLQTAWTDSRFDRMENELACLDRALSELLSESHTS